MAACPQVSSSPQGNSRTVAANEWNVLQGKGRNSTLRLWLLLLLLLLLVDAGAEQRQTHTQQRQTTATNPHVYRHERLQWARVVPGVEGLFGRSVWLAHKFAGSCKLSEKV
jgi:hypothetical protein